MIARTAPFVVLLALVTAAAAPVCAAPVSARVGDLVTRPGEVPRRIVGYGLVTGLDGTGDRSFGSTGSATPTVRSIVNLLRRFDLEVPQDRLRPRDVAAVVVTAEVSPWLRAGGRFEVQVSAIGDATSLRGGVLWITPLVTDPGQPPVATAQGPLLVAGEEPARSLSAGRGGNRARIPQGGLLEADLPLPATAARLLLRDPGLGTATHIAERVNATFGAGAARVEDPGAVALRPPAAAPDSVFAFLAAVDTLWVDASGPSRVVIDGRVGTVVAGGDVRVGPASVSHHGLTLEIGATAPPAGAPVTGLVRVDGGASVEDVAAALHTAGARPDEIAAVFESLHAAGALRAELVVR